MRKAIVWVFAAASGLTLSGCGDKSTGGGSDGSGSSAPAAVIDPKSAVGTWNADMTPIIAMLKPMAEMGLKAAEGMGAAGGDAAESKKKLDEAKKKIAELEKMEMTMELKSGGAATFHATMGDDGPENGTGKWTQTGDQVTVKMETSNGKPAEGNKGEEKKLTLKDGVLTMTEGPFTINFKRK